LKGLGLFISGPASSGKTFLTTLVGKSLFEKGLTGYFCSLTSLLNSIAETWSTFISEIKGFDFLCIDDFYAFVKDTSFFLPLLRDIFSYFEVNKKPLIINSRSSLKDFYSTPFRDFVPVFLRFLIVVNLPSVYDPNQTRKLREKYEV